MFGFRLRLSLFLLGHGIFIRGTTKAAPSLLRSCEARANASPQREPQSEGFAHTRSRMSSFACTNTARPVSVVCAERRCDGGDEGRAANLTLVSPIDNAEAVRDVFCESACALVALVALMLFAYPRGIYLSGSLPCGLRYCNLRHPSLARAPANSLTMLCSCDCSHRLLVPAVHDRVPLPAFRGRRRAAGLGRPWALFRWRSGCRGGDGRVRGC